MTYAQMIDATEKNEMRIFLEEVGASFSDVFGAEIFMSIFVIISSTITIFLSSELHTFGLIVLVIAVLLFYFVGLYKINGSKFL